MRATTIIKIKEALKRIDSEDLDFHAARYESGEAFQNLVIASKEEKISDLECEISAIADLGVEDGGNWGTIPCLGGFPEKVWRACLLAWGSGDESELDLL